VCIERSNQVIEFTVDEETRVGEVVLNAPDKLNALDEQAIG